METIDMILESIGRIATFSEMTGIAALEHNHRYNESWLYVSPQRAKKVLEFAQTNSVVSFNSYDRLVQFSQGIADGGAEYKQAVAAAIAEYCILQQKIEKLKAAHSNQKLDRDTYVRTKETSLAIEDLSHAVRGYEAAIALGLKSDYFHLVGNFEPARQLVGTNYIPYKKKIIGNPSFLSTLVENATVVSSAGKYDPPAGK